MISTNRFMRSTGATVCRAWFALALILLSTARPAGAQTSTWRQINGGLPSVGNNDIRALAADPVDPQVMYGGFSYAYGMSHGVFKTTDGGAHWVVADTGLRSNATVTALAIDPANRSTVYAIDNYDLYRSVDGAANWTKITTLPNDVWCVAAYNGVVYVGGYTTFYRSSDSGDHFATTYSSPGGGTANKIWIQPAVPNRVVAAVGASLFQTADGGHSWTEYTALNSSVCNMAYTTAFDVDPSNYSHMLVGTWHCIASTTDGGATWTKVRDIGYTNGLRFDPLKPSVVYATSSYLGPSTVLRSTDGGATWSTFTAGLNSGFRITALELGPSPLAGATESAAYVGLTGWGPFTTAPETPIPGVTVIDPFYGDVAGGTTVSLWGKNFVAGDTSVSLGGSPASNVVVTSATELTAVTPAHGPGPVTAAVTTTAGTGSLANGFVYVRAMPAFSDEPLVVRATVVKASHVAELRQRIDELRARHLLVGFSWTNPTLSVGTTAVSSLHIAELRAALAGVYSAVGQTPPTYTPTVIDPGKTPIAAVQIEELRVAVASLWDAYKQRSVAPGRVR
jgi:photosystem II stability/assembly factor-like uncharacterized protein